MKRGWILTYSLLLMVIVFVGICYPLWFVLSILALIPAGIVTGVLFCGLVYFWWAPNNLYFTFVPEGRAKIVVRGDAFEEALIQWKGRTFDRVENKWDVVEEGTLTSTGVPHKEPWHPFGGLRYYGFWPIKDIYIYDFSWTNVRSNGEIQEHDKEIIDHVLVKDDVYWAKVEKAEDKQLLPLDVELTLTIRVANPYKAVFVIQSWLEAVLNRLGPAVRDALTEHTYEEWISEKEDLAGRIMRDEEVGELLREEFRERYGLEVRKIEVRSINPTQVPEEDKIRFATIKKYLAEREKDRITTEAKAERKRIETVAEGERKRITRVYQQIQKFGKLGELVRVLEAMEKSPGEGARWVIPLPGMTELLSQVFPGRRPDSLAPEEIRALREIIERFQQGS